ncbi:MAG: excinuclease subunit UvrA [Clostridia bacterium]|nr:excinuclease subunit UvrA [Clostridia bacterium]
MNNIIIKGVKEGNLKNISLEIPKNKLVVFTGLSGSGKSTLAIDTIYQECQRQYLEAIGYQGIHKPKIDYIRNVSPSVKITQNEYINNKNPRSSVGTVTNIYTDLRMIYEKLSKRSCPKCNKEIISSECKEEVEKLEGNFKVYMYCNHCNHKMDKLTRSHFSYNTEEGACKTCQGLGKVLQINRQNVINENLSAEDGAVDFWDQAYKDYQITSLYNAFKHYGVPIEPNTPVKDYNKGQEAILLYGAESNEVKKLFPSEICSDCRGERLNELSRSVTVSDTRLPELVSLSLQELNQWLLRLEASVDGINKIMTEAYLSDLKTKINRIVNVGLGYLSLDRQTMTLSGGEAQRIKLAATLDSGLTGIIYIMDEPTIGLHPKDTVGIIKILKDLRDLENTVIVIEHDIDVMREADYIVDIGPGSGKYGGEIIGKGSLEDIMKQDSSVTGGYFKKKVQNRKELRKGTGFVEVKNANLYNLKNINVKFPVGCLTSVTGVSGSGKSTLVFEVLAKANIKNQTDCNRVEGSEVFDRIVTVEQSPLTRMKRSNVATYCEVYSEIRKIFGGLKAAADKGLTVKHFSFNIKGGRCENCEGLGYITSNMLFFENIEVPCPVCGGNQFNDEVLSVKYKGYNIKDILRMSVEDAIDTFDNHPKILKILKLLKDVGLSYLELGQTLTTLSGGEGQRLKLATELINNEGKYKKNLYLIDEPTTGLHPIDVENFLVLLNRMVASGNTIIIVEHNQQVIKASDWIIDLGPEGGINGGKVIAEGTPDEIKLNESSVTGKYL